MKIVTIQFSCDYENDHDETTPRLCRRCGHDELRHRENVVTARTDVGDAVACWHLTDPYLEGRRQLCGCTALVAAEAGARA